MVGAFHRGLLTLLQHIHESTDTTTQTPAGRRRSMYRYWRTHAPVVYPNIAYTSLGLRHEHLLITDPGPVWETLPSTIESAWTARTPGERTLYLHCLVPSEQHQAFLTQLAEWEATACTALQRISTGDAWQSLAPLTDAIDEEGRPTGRNTHDAPVPPPAPTTQLASAHPLLIPVATTLHGQRRSAHDAWTAIYARLGERVWDLLPRRTRRWRHNGKTYVTRALRTLHEYGLVRQHIIRYPKLQTHMTEVLLLMTPNALPAVRSVAPVVEIYQGENIVLARATGDIALIKTIFQHEAITGCWFIDAREPPRTVFRYDLLGTPVRS